MINNRLQNIAKLSALYIGCLILMIAASEAGLNDNWSAGIGIAYFLIILVLQSRGIFEYFRGISIPGAYAFTSLMAAHYTYEATRDHSYLSILAYVMMLNFLVSCGYLIYSLHTFKPGPGGERVG